MKQTSPQNLYKEDLHTSSEPSSNNNICIKKYNYTKKLYKIIKFVRMIIILLEVLYGNKRIKKQNRNKLRSN